MTLALLDTNTYLRLAKRIRPMLGVEFGQRGYVLTVLKQVETEVQDFAFSTPGLMTQNLPMSISQRESGSAELRINK